jgi:hypothetical protein
MCRIPTPKLRDHGTPSPPALPGANLTGMYERLSLT